MHPQRLFLLYVASSWGKRYWDCKLLCIEAQIELSSTFVYDQKMSTSGSSARNLHLSQGGRMTKRSVCKGYRPEARGYVIYSPRATTSWRPINGLFLHSWRGFLKGCKNTSWRKMSLLFIFLLFFNTPCWHWWHSQVSRLFNYVSFSKSHFKLVVRSEC